MNQKHVKKIADELNLAPWQIEATAALLSDGATVPFIARYRKEVTGSLDEVAIAAIRDRLAQLADSQGGSYGLTGDTVIGAQVRNG